MSTERPSNRPLKPSVAPASRNARTPIAPRLAATNNATISSKDSTARSTPTLKQDQLTPRVKETTTPIHNAIANGNVTPRSSARLSRVDSNNSSPSLADSTPTAPRPKSAFIVAQGGSGKSGLGISAGLQNKTPTARPKSLVSGKGNGMQSAPALIKSPGASHGSEPLFDNDRFFHASDAPKQLEPTVKKPEPKKSAAFFYADGQKETEPASPVLSAVSEQRSTGPWIRAEMVGSPPKSPPILSPALSSLSSISPFFAPATSQGSSQRPSAPSKENIHLSYRKGVSQIFGNKPTPSPRTTASSVDLAPVTPGFERTISQDSSSGFFRHHKSPSLSSIDSTNSQRSRRRSATNADTEPGVSPLAFEVKPESVPRVAPPPIELPSIDTSLEFTGARSPLDGAFSPTKAIANFAADARRERKVLDLEISNSSLLAINASLEREIRKQKSELKRFRRLSRAGRFSFAPGEGSAARLSDGLSVVGEEDEDDEAMFGMPSGLSEFYDNMSDDDDQSLASSSEPLSPSAQSNRDRSRLERDEKHLQHDLAKHKELLVQSQAMNQSIKRCTSATEDMIREGKKALEYHVRVSDVKMGGRVLSVHADDDHHTEEIEVDEGPHDIDIDQAQGFLDTWSGVGRPSVESSEGGDRDSGIEADRPPPPRSLPFRQKVGSIGDLGRPPGPPEGSKSYGFGAATVTS
ncbi:hypothetical protein LTR09_001046 [Extremus antarcticus]|uniref:Uncharacterized protein n=1 Tax=Extremus antarcticus TaxID=702011 RepID=A0AAJ0GI32_9PEZI|nr:hypothetical protein LTR09_001046 [Extremus antarcticus]